MIDEPAATRLRWPEPSHRGPTGLGSFELPPDLLEKARGRLARFSLLMALVYVGVAVLAFVLYAEMGVERHVITVFQASLGAVVLLQFGLYVLARGRRVSHALVLNLGLIYEVVLCFSIALGDSWVSLRMHGIVPEVNFSSLIIAVYPLIVPSPPRRALLASLAAAATNPLALSILASAGAADFTPIQYVVLTLTPAIAVLLAVFGSQQVYGLNRDVARARDLGSYHLERRLGRGGMGEVWLGRHRLLARPAAIKLVRPEMLAKTADDRLDVVLQRFEREAQATARMSSPHTIQVYDFGIADEGTFYYVMELLDGLDLESLVQHYGPVRPERVIHFLRQACDSLAEAHEHGLIHRDIKPANLYVCRYGRQVDFIKVLDFGLVKPQEGADDGDVRLTRERQVGGTPAYMAPELVLGHSIDARADLYALGCVAYWLLTGELVFEGETAMEVMTHHAHSPPPPLTPRSEFAIPPALEATILACLEKDPTRRPASADALAARLDVCEVPTWTRERARQWWETHRPRSAASSDEATPVA